MVNSRDISSNLPFVCPSGHHLAYSGWLQLDVLLMALALVQKQYIHGFNPVVALAAYKMKSI